MNDTQAVASWCGTNDCPPESMCDVCALEARVVAAQQALQKIADQQPIVVAYIEANGFVFDDIGREPGNWQHLAFSIYTDLCLVDTWARTALADLEARA